MQNFVPLLIEALLFLFIYLLATISTGALRRPYKDAEHRAPTVRGGMHYLLAHVARPAAVLALSKLAVWLLSFPPVTAYWMQLYKAHTAAWLSFWAIVLLVNLVEGIAQQVCAMRGRKFPIPDLLNSIMRWLLITAAVFVVLRLELDIDISPLLASTALVTAVVGFALQGVLSNLLAGMSLHITRSVAPSDWVSIGGVEGKVMSTNWRETRLLTYNGHVMIVPNSTVSSSIIHNMTWPDPVRRHVFNVGASYSDAPGDVIDALTKSALNVPGVLREPAPDAFISEYKDYGINYVLRYWTRCYYERPAVDGDVGRMIWYEFKRRGIEIPFPMSDKLLNDFMEVVYSQRRKEPDKADVQRRMLDLKTSDFCTGTLVDRDGYPLLGDEQLLAIARAVRRVRYTRGETLFRQGDAGDNCYVIVNGQVEGRVEYENAELNSEFTCGPGALLGEMSLMTGLPRTATIVAGGEVELLEIPQQAFACLLASHQDIPGILSRLVADRAAFNAVALEELKTMKSVNVAESLRQENILKRFLRILGRQPGQG